MVKRGRKSAAELAVQAANVELVERPRPPAELNDEQASIWRDVVNDHPADWFNAATFPLLTAYCRHTVISRRIDDLMSAEINRVDPMGLIPFDLEKMDKLTKMLTRETSAISQLATKMRIAQQSTVTAVQNKKRIGKKPWEPE